MLREVRRRLWPVLDSVLSLFGGYASQQVGEEGYVGTVEMTLEDVELLLEDLGFEFEMVSALKHRSCPQEPEVAAGSWVKRESVFARQQLHVHLFSGRDDSYTDVYAHYEPSWLRSPVKHYRSSELEFDVGVALTEEMLEGKDVDVFEREPEERCMM